MTIQSRDAMVTCELLAPAGSSDAFYAAIGAGADAVYLGLYQFNARQGADNFTLDELTTMCREAHAHGARVYLTVNVVILGDEMQEVVDLIGKAWEAGIDAVIVQDLGLISVLGQCAPHIRLHGSTQINAHDSATVRVLSNLGLQRVTLSRETSVREIETLAAVGREAGIEIESFVHGAICVCYSGQCLLSSLIGRRSANRGQCAQPCRLPYELIDKKGEAQPAEGKHLLSPKDLAGIEQIPALVKAGVASLKIEGRMKSASYVAAVVATYREALDRALADEPFENPESAYEYLSEAFNRGFTQAYLVGDRSNTMMSYKRPNNRGVSIGRIVGFESGRAIVILDKNLDSQDTIEIWTNSGRFTQPAGELMTNDGPQTSVLANSRVAIDLHKHAQEGDRVFRVRNHELAQQAQVAIESTRDFKKPLDMRVFIEIAKPLRLEVSAPHQGRQVTVAYEGPVIEQARTKALTAEDVHEHINRLGGTPYKIGDYESTISDGVGLGFSTIHSARRQAIELWETQAYFDGVPRVYEPRTIPALPKARLHHDGVDVVAVVSTMGAARAALNGGANQAHIAAYQIDSEEEPADSIIPVLPRVCHDHELETYLGVAYRFGRAVCSTLGQLDMCKRRDIPAISHWSLNVTNAYSAMLLATLGAEFVWLSPELSGRQTASLAAVSPVSVGIAMGGLTEVMVTEHCVLMALGPCSQRCDTCTRRQDHWALRDRKGYCFPVRTDPTGRTHIYNSVPLDLTDALPEIIESGVGAIRLDIETMLTGAVSREVARVRHALIDAYAGREVSPLSAIVTRGHFYRGIT